MKRIQSVDALRAMAIIFMVLCHAVIYLSSESDHIIGDFAAPIFAFVMGISQAISLTRYFKTDNADKSVKRALRRGGTIVILGLFFGFLSWGPEGLIAWDVLPFLGFSTIALALTRNTRSYWFFVWSAVIVILAPFGREWSGYLNSWGGYFVEAPWLGRLSAGMLMDPIQEYQPRFDPGEIFQGFLIEGDFPLLPWLIFPFIGYAVGRWLMQGHKLLWLTPAGILLSVMDKRGGQYSLEWPTAYACS